MMNAEEREIALAQMEQVVLDFYRQAQVIHNHPFLEFAGVMTAYVKSCRAAHEQGIDFSECNVHSGTRLPIESFEIAYVNEKLNCIFGGRIVATSEATPKRESSDRPRDLLTIEPPKPTKHFGRGGVIRWIGICKALVRGMPREGCGSTSRGPQASFSSVISPLICATP